MPQKMYLITVLSVLTNINVLSAQTLQSPSNITRTVGETNIFIPCPFEFGLSPPFWRINGTDYSSATLPSIYSQTFGGLFINEATHCLDQTTFQCIDTSSAGLFGQESSVGVLSVHPQGMCDGDLTSALTGRMELNHWQMEYTNTNITIAWQIFSDSANCSVSQIQSCPQPNSNSIDINNRTTSTSYTIQSELLQTLEGLSLSSLSDPPGENCPSMTETINFNVNETINVPLLRSNTYCSCIEIPCDNQGILSVAIANPNPRGNDIICNAALSLSDINHATNVRCYDVKICPSFNSTEYGYPPFFHICENPMDSSRCSICFQHLNELNRTRIDFFYLRRVTENCAGIVHNRLYFKSIILNGIAASANFILDVNSGEICFSSVSQDCDLVNLTHYTFSITDITGNLVFRNEERVPESTCVILGRPFLPQCSPFLVFVRPINNNIEYESISKKVYVPAESDDDELSQVCSCLNETVQLHLSARESPISSSFVIDYTCSSLYLTPITIIIYVMSSAGTSHEYRIMCENLSGRISESINNTNCGSTFEIWGEWSYINGSTRIICQPLFSTEFVGSPCLTTGPAPNNTNPPVSVAVPVVVVVVILVTVVVVIIAVVVYLKRRLKNDGKDKGTDPSIDLRQNTDLSSGVTINDELTSKEPVPKNPTSSAIGETLK